MSSRLGESHSNNSPEAVEHLVAQVRGHSWTARQSAAEILGRIGDDRAVLPLVGSLRREDWPIPGVLRGLRDLGREDCWPPQRFAREWRAHLREEIGSVLPDARHLGEVEERLLEVESADWESRLGAVYALGRLGQTAALPSLRFRLSDVDSSIRARAAEALGLLGDGESAALLVEALTDREAPVRACAAKALGLLHAVEAVEPLVRLLPGEPMLFVGNEFVNAMGSLGDVSAVGTIVDYQRAQGDQVPVPEVRTALAALGRGVVPILEEHLVSASNRGVREVCALVLGELGASRSIGPLRRARFDPDTGVRDAAAEALSKLERRS